MTLIRSLVVFNLLLGTFNAIAECCSENRICNKIDGDCNPFNSTLLGARDQGSKDTLELGSLIGVQTTILYGDIPSSAYSKSQFCSSCIPKVHKILSGQTSSSKFNFEQERKNLEVKFREYILRKKIDGFFDQAKVAKEVARHYASISFTDSRSTNLQGLRRNCFNEAEGLISNIKNRILGRGGVMGFFTGRQNKFCKSLSNSDIDKVEFNDLWGKRLSSQARDVDGLNIEKIITNRVSSTELDASTNKCLSRKEFIFSVENVYRDDWEAGQNYLIKTLDDHDEIKRLHNICRKNKNSFNAFDALTNGDQEIKKHVLRAAALKPVVGMTMARSDILCEQIVKPLYAKKGKMSVAKFFEQGGEALAARILRKFYKSSCRDLIENISTTACSMEKDISENDVKTHYNSFLKDELNNDLNKSAALAGATCSLSKKLKQAIESKADVAQPQADSGFKDLHSEMVSLKDHVKKGNVIASYSEEARSRMNSDSCFGKKDTDNSTREYARSIGFTNIREDVTSFMDTSSEYGKYAEHLSTNKSLDTVSKAVISDENEKKVGIGTLVEDKELTEENYKQNMNMGTQFTSRNSANSVFSQSDIQRAVVENPAVAQTYSKAISQLGKESVDEYINSGNVSSKESERLISENDSLRAELDLLRKQLAELNLQIDEKKRIESNEELSTIQEKIAQLEKQIAGLNNDIPDITKPKEVEASSSVSPIKKPQSVYKEETKRRGGASQVEQDVSSSDILKNKALLSIQNQHHLLLKLPKGQLYKLDYKSIKFSDDQTEIVSVLIEGKEIPFEQLTEEQKRQLSLVIPNHKNLTSQLNDQKRMKVVLEKQKEEVSSSVIRYKELLKELNREI